MPDARKVCRSWNPRELHRPTIRCVKNAAGPAHLVRGRLPGRPDGRNLVGMNAGFAREARGCRIHRFSPELLIAVEVEDDRVNGGDALRSRSQQYRGPRALRNVKVRTVTCTRAELRNGE